MTPKELAEIEERDRYMGYVSEDMNVSCRRDRRRLLAEVKELREIQQAALAALEDEPDD